MYFPSLGHWWLGNVHFDSLIGLIMGSVPTIWISAKMDKSLPEKYTWGALASVLFLVGLKLVA